MLAAETARSDPLPSYVTGLHSVVRLGVVLWGEVGQSYALLSAQATKVSAEHSHRSLLPLQTAAIVTDKYVCKQVQVCTGVAQL